MWTMGSVNTTEQRMSYILYYELALYTGPISHFQLQYSTFIRRGSHCLHSKSYQLFVCIPPTYECLGNPTQIEQWQVEFWNVSKKDMERKERRCYPYPPRFTVTVDGMQAKTDANAKFIFKGIMPDIEQEILLRSLSHNGTEILDNGSKVCIK